MSPHPLPRGALRTSPGAGRIPRAPQLCSCSGFEEFKVAAAHDSELKLPMETTLPMSIKDGVGESTESPPQAQSPTFLPFPRPHGLGD